MSVNDWEEELVDAFSRIYKDVHLFTWPVVRNFFDGKEQWEGFCNDLNKNLRNEFDAFYSAHDRILVFIYASDFSIDAASVEYMKRKNTFLISFCWDDLLYFKGKVKGQPVGIHKLSASVDMNLTLSPEAISRYEYYGSACYFWESVPIALTATQTGPDTVVDTDFYVLFIGSKYGWRSEFIRRLTKRGIKVVCYGSGWENGRLSKEEVKEKIRSAPLTLGFSSVGYTRSITTIKGRDFEVPLWRGLYLTQYSKGLDYYYKPEEEILTYTSLEDCISKIRFVQENPAVANKIRLAGFTKAARSASWESRLLYLSNLVNRVTDMARHI